MSCSKCIMDWLIRMHVWWSRCTDRYQLWDKPFSKVNNRRKKLLCQTFFLCVGTFLQSSVRNNVSCVYVFFLSCFQSKPIDIYLSFGFVFPRMCVCLVLMHGMLSCLFRDLFVLSIWKCRSYFSISEWHVFSIRLEILKYFSITFFFSSVKRDTNSNEIWTAHIDNGRPNSLAGQRQRRSDIWP